MSKQQALIWTHNGQKPKYADPDTLALIVRCQAGDETAYVSLYNQHAPMVYRLAYGLLQQREDAEEVMQDSFEYAFRKLAHYNPNKSAFTTWLYRIAVSRCRNKRRRKWLPTLSIGLLGENELADQRSLEPDEILELDDRQRAIWTALSQLSPKLRETAVLRYYNGFGYNEIGAILGIPPKTAESRMRLAHKALRQRLAGSDLEES